MWSQVQNGDRKTIELHIFQGQKKQKCLVATHVCCNADESEKYELMFIGKAERLKAFKKSLNKNTVLTIIKTKNRG